MSATHRSERESASWYFWTHSGVVHLEAGSVDRALIVGWTLSANRKRAHCKGDECSRGSLLLRLDLRNEAHYVEHVWFKGGMESGHHVCHSRAGGGKLSERNAAAERSRCGVAVNFRTNFAGEEAPQLW